MSLDEFSVKMTMPVLLDDPDIVTLQMACQSRINFLMNHYGCDDDDIENQIYEAAMIAFYGENIFDWINLQIE